MSPRHINRTLSLRFLAHCLLTILATVPVASLVVLFQNARGSTIGWLTLLTFFIAPILLIWLGRAVTALARCILDLLDGPRMLTGYVTFRYSWLRGGRENYSLNIVPADNFDRWRGRTSLEPPKPAQFTDADFYYIPSPGENRFRENQPAIVAPTSLNLPDVLTFSPPEWVFDKVRLGDMVRLVYSPHNKVIFEVEVILTIDLTNSD
jgi:hypothetical protein